MSAASAVSGTDHPVVVTTSGAVRGRWRESGGARSAAFLGVPFAEPPVGDLRFAAPQRRTPWDGVRDAAEYGPTAQPEQLVAVTTIPEPSTPGDDVLNLNVFTPAPGDRSAQLPALVWIHGGGFMAGCQNSSWYDGSTFNRDGIVTVSIGYRLGAEGFLRLPGSPDNRAALDWVAALTWVQENIAEFGGDPSRVTIAGQSAGGGAVLALLTMPAAQALFSRAMSISGALRIAPLAEAAHTTRRFAEAVGRPATPASLAHLSRAQLHDAVKAVSVGPGGIPTIVLAPYADGDTFPTDVLDAVRRGLGGEKPLLLGTTAHEFAMAGAGVADDLPDAALVAALTGIGLDPQDAATAAAERTGSPGALVGQAVTDVTFRRPALEVAEARAAAGAAPTWLYEFAWPSAAPGTDGLSFHCLDLPFWWDRLDGERVVDATGPGAPQELATAMHDAMTGFVTGGSPGWPAFDLATRAGRVLGSPATRPFAHVLGRRA